MCDMLHRAQVAIDMKRNVKNIISSINQKDMQIGMIARGIETQ